MSARPAAGMLTKYLAALVEQHRVDLVIVNGENSAAGFGITPKIADELLALGADVITGGNHSWDRKEILEFIPNEPRLLRPANFRKVPDAGCTSAHRAALVTRC